MRSDEQLETVEAMFASGVSDYEIARRSGVPRSTVQRWRSGRVRVRVDQQWRPKLAEEYAYVLGLYLATGTSCTEAARAF